MSIIINIMTISIDFDTFIQKKIYSLNKLSFIINRPMKILYPETKRIMCKTEKTLWHNLEKKNGESTFVTL